MSDKEFISGIYNYCDRWCEKCDFADRCKIYYEERKNFNALENKDDFISIVSQNLDSVKKMILKIAEDKGLDLDDIKDEAAFKRAQEKSKEAREHPLSQMAMDYARLANQWLRDQNDLERHKKKFETNIEIGINVDDSDSALRLLDEALNIIHWYVFQIHIKLSSAIRYYPHDPEFEDEIQNMHHSSAKIALIGVENSMKAWHIILECLNEEEDFILEVLLLLQRIKSKINLQFPLLKKYKRPFFED